MSETYYWSENDSLRKGPFPLVPTLNGELRLSGKEDAYHQVLLANRLGARALMPLYLELYVPNLHQASIPEQFAKAHDAVHGSVADSLQDARGKREGTVCVLPEPLSLGISTVVLWQPDEPSRHRADLNWHISNLTLLTQDASMFARHFSSIKPGYVSGLGMLTEAIPTLSDDLAVQQTFEQAVHTQLESLPDSLDSVEEFAPGIFEVTVRDGRTLDSHDYLTVSRFIKAAESVNSYNPGFAKGTFMALARHITNEQLARLAKQDPSAAREQANHLENLFQPLYWHTATTITPTMPRTQVGIDYELVRDAAQAVMRGDVKLEGVGKKGVDILRMMFDEH